MTVRTFKLAVPSQRYPPLKFFLSVLPHTGNVHRSGAVYRPKSTAYRGFLWNFGKMSQETPPLMRTNRKRGSRAPHSRLNLAKRSVLRREQGLARFVGQVLSVSQAAGRQGSNVFGLRPKRALPRPFGVVLRWFFVEFSGDLG